MYIYTYVYISTYNNTNRNDDKEEHTNKAYTHSANTKTSVTTNTNTKTNRVLGLPHLLVEYSYCISICLQQLLCALHNYTIAHMYSMFISVRNTFMYILLLDALMCI